MVLVRSLLALCLASVLVSVVDAQTTGGGHFRFATIFWERVDDDTSNTVRITVESAWRRSYSSNYFTAAQHPDGSTLMKINGKESPMLDFGDGTIQYLEAVKITAWSESEDWFMGEEVFTKTFDTPLNNGIPWLVKFKGCCRLSTLTNNADKGWEMHTHIDLTVTDSSPRVVSLPVTYAQKPLVAPYEAFFNLRTAMASDAVTWRMATPGVDAPADFDALSSVISVESDGRLRILTNRTGLVHVLAYASYANKPSIKVPVDMLIMITPSAASDPQFAGETAALLSELQHARPGFEYKVDISGHAKTATPGLFVGMTVGPLPDGAHLSTVRGTGSSPTEQATLTFIWKPCTKQTGLHIVCFDVVNSLGIAATQRCLSIHVTIDEAPTMHFMWNGMAINTSSTVPLYIGSQHAFTVVARDENMHDHLAVMLTKADGSACTPPDCMPAPPGAHVHAPVMSVVDGMAQTMMDMTFAPAHNHGGYMQHLCATVKDSCGEGCADDVCPGVEDVVVACITIKVNRCEFIVRPGQELQEIAAIYHTDWLQLWSHNQELLNPDVSLRPSTKVNIGHLYDIQPFDKPADVAQRFGMDAKMFEMLNANVMADKMDVEQCQSIMECSGMQWCVLPNSCVGNSGSIYQGAYQDNQWFATTVDGPGLGVPPVAPVGGLPTSP